MSRRGTTSDPLGTELVRQTLLNLVHHHDGVVLVEAPVGYGKATLVRQASVLPGAVGVASLHDAVGAAEATGATSVVVQTEVHDRDVGAMTGPTGLVGSAGRAARRGAVGAADGVGATGVVGHLARTTDAAHDVLDVFERAAVRNLVVTGHWFSPSFRSVIDGLDVLDIGWRELRFSDSEIEQLAATSLPEEVRVPFTSLIGPFSEGWPSAVNASLQMVARSTEPYEALRSVVSSPMHTRRLIEPLADHLDPEAWHGVTQLAHLGSFSESVASALLGPEGVDRIRRAGFPLLGDDHQRLRMPHAVVETLRASSPLEREVVARLTPALIADGSLLTALRLLVTVGAAGDAADLLITTGSSRLDDVEQVRLLSLIDLLGSEAERSPGLHLIRARVERNLARLAASRASLEAAERGAEAVGDHLLAMEARLERLLGAALAGVDDAATTEEIERIASAGADLDVRLRLRLREIEAVRVSQRPEPAAVLEASVDLREVAIQWEHLGDNGRAAATLRVLASGALSHLGHYREAQELLRRASQLTWNKAFDRLLTAELSARLDVLAGDLDAHARNVAEARSLLAGLEFPWIEAYLSWWSMLAAALRADRAEVASLFHRCERQLGELLASQTGAVFHAEAATAFALVGDADQAVELLGRATAHEQVDELEAAMAGVIVSARAGQIASAEAHFRTLAASGRLPPDREWRPVLELVRAGAVLPPLAESAAVAAVQGLGLDELVALIGLADAPAPVEQAPHPPMGVSVLGGFAVTVEGRPVDVPPGHVSRLLKLLAVRPSGVPVEVAIDLLWPDMPEDVGRRRLKNVVNRLRGTVGQQLIRRDRGALALDPEVVVDVAGFERAVTEALAATPMGDTQWIDASVRALTLYRGELLPDDRYDDWLETERLSARSRAVAVLERLLDAGPRDGPPAPWLLDVALRVDTESTRLYLAVAERAVAEQQLACAEAALDHVRSVAATLGVDVERQVVAVEERISA